MTYWVTKTDDKKKTSDGRNNDIEITRISFKSAAEANAYVKKKNDEHHEYMLETHDRAELGVSYDAMTDDRIQELQRRGVNFIDKRP